MELLLRPKRTAFTQKKCLEQHHLQGGRCALCDAEIRLGADGECEDEGDHVQPLHSSVAGEPQKFRLLCLSCHKDVSDPGVRREAEILRSYFNLETLQFCSSPKPVPATWVCEKLDARRALMHLDIKRCRKSNL